MPTTAGQYLLNSLLPKGYKLQGPATNKELKRVLSALAKDHPDKYVEIVPQIKRLGDEFATVEGVSVGLDDIAPHYAERDPILREAFNKIKHETNHDKRNEILINAQAKMREKVLNHPGDLSLMAKSGGRGNAVQLMKTVSSPVAVTDPHGNIVPWLIKHSYSEGLSPAEYWIAGDEARMNVITGKTSVVEPGEVGKLMLNTMYDQVVTTTDCGTHNGLAMPVSDASDLLDRYLAKPAGGHPYNALLTSQVIDDLRKKKVDLVTVRSPMTCALHSSGVCQKCMGVNNWGQDHTIGTNVGVIAATASSEPLTQMSLSAKHSTRLAKGQSAEPEGIKAVKSLLEIPEKFMYAATTAKKTGKVESIEKAPQGGHFLYIGDEQHYVPPELALTVHRGDAVEAGDTLSEGVAKPDEVVEHKGMGVGRKYLIDQLHKVYTKAGIGLDKRHLELLARAQLNHVEIEDDPKDEFLRGDVVNFNSVRNRLAEDAKDTDLDKAHGKTLAQDYLHFTAGTKVTQSVIDKLKPHFSSVQVTNDPLKFKFIMHPLSQVPLLRPGFMTRLSHNHIKQTLLQAAQRSEDDDLHGLHPIPGFIAGTTFGNGPDGAY